MANNEPSLFRRGIDTIAGRLGYVSKAATDSPKYNAVSYLPLGGSLFSVNPDAYKSPKLGVRKPTNISFSLLRQVAKHDAIIRICINAIKKSVSQSKWDVVLKEGEKMTPEIKSQIDYLKKLFLLQNKNNENMRILLDRVIEDLLVLDAGVIEKVRNINGQIVGLNSVDGATIRPRYNAWGEFDPDAAYVQVVNEKEVATFKQEEMIYMMANPQNEIALFGYGMSPIESILLTVQASLNADMFNARAFSDDNVPPGMVDLGDMSEEQAQQFIRIWDNTVISDTKRIKFVWGSKEPIKYTAFQKNNKDMQFIEYIDWLSRLKLATYGLTPMDANITHDVNRSTANAERDISNSRGVHSTKRLFEEYFNREIVATMGFDAIEFKFAGSENISESKTRAEIDKIYVECGVLSPEEIRIREGFSSEEEQLENSDGVNQEPEEPSPSNANPHEVVDVKAKETKKAVRKSTEVFTSRFYPPLVD